MFSRTDISAGRTNDVSIQQGALVLVNQNMSPDDKPIWPTQEPNQTNTIFTMNRNIKISSVYPSESLLPTPLFILPSNENLLAHTKQISTFITMERIRSMRQPVPNGYPHWLLNDSVPTTIRQPTTATATQLDRLSKLHAGSHSRKARTNEATNQTSASHNPNKSKFVSQTLLHY